MCGIVGYVGQRDAVSFILPSLRRLEYRGYDSAGIATVFGFWSPSRFSSLRITWQSCAAAMWTSLGISPRA